MSRIFSSLRWCHSPIKSTMKDIKREVADAAKAIKHYSFAQRDQAVKIHLCTSPGKPSMIQGIRGKGH